jgi:hypothetical protein
MLALYRIICIAVCLFLMFSECMKTLLVLHTTSVENSIWHDACVLCASTACAYAYVNALKVVLYMEHQVETAERRTVIQVVHGGSKTGECKTEQGQEKDNTTQDNGGVQEKTEQAEPTEKLD